MGAAGPYWVTAQPVSWQPYDSPADDDRQINSEDRRSVRLRVRPPPTGTHRCHGATPSGRGDHAHSQVEAVSFPDRLTPKSRLLRCMTLVPFGSGRLPAVSHPGCSLWQATALFSSTARCVAPCSSKCWCWRPQPDRWPEDVGGGMETQTKTAKTRAAVRPHFQLTCVQQLDNAIMGSMVHRHIAPTELWSVAAPAADCA